MKKIILFFICLSSLEVYSQTNIYHPFPDSNAHWHGVIFSGAVPPYPGIIGNFDYILNGNDTIINSITYKKIIGFTGGWYKQLIGIRQDIANKKVIGIDGNTLQEFLLYDFAVNIGDTIHFRPLVDCDTISIVNSIDSVLVGSTFRKRINLDMNVSLIEGIGSTSGLVESNCFEGGNLLCYFTESNIVYSDSPWLCKPNAIEEIDLKNNISIYPNPTKNYIKISFKRNLSFKHICLNDIYGRKLYEYKMKNSELTIDINNYPIGLYFIVVIDEKQKTYTKTILKE